MKNWISITRWTDLVQIIYPVLGIIQLLEVGWNTSDFLYLILYPVLLLFGFAAQGLWAANAFASSHWKYDEKGGRLIKVVKLTRSKLSRFLPVITGVLFLVSLHLLKPLIDQLFLVWQDPGWVWMDRNTMVFFGIEFFFLLYLVNKLLFFCFTFSWKRIQALGVRRLEST